MWSPTLVPKPKDWPDHIDVVGAFSENLPTIVASRKPSANSLTSPLNLSKVSSKSFHEQEHQYKIYQSGTTPNKTAAFDPSVRRAKSEDALLPVITNNEEYEPSEDLAAFLSGDQPIIYVGFGSMVVSNLEKIISLFLEAAALINAKILIQIGWSIITPEQFQELAAAAQYKAGMVRETEKLNSNLAESVIFPSSNSRSTSVDQKGGMAATSSSTMPETVAAGSSPSSLSWILGKLPFANASSSSSSSSIPSHNQPSV